MEYGDIHRFLLRYVMSRGVVGTTEAEQVLSKYTGSNEVTPLVDLVKSINEQMKSFQILLKVTNHEVTDEEIIVLVSLARDEVSRSQNMFNAKKLEYFQLLLKQILTTDSRQITRRLAINIANEMVKPLTRTKALKVLDIWCKMYYLDKENSNYALGVRTIHEFEEYIQLNLPDKIKECCLCKHNVYRGYNCPICAKAVHTKCLKPYLVAEQKWPCCKSDYNYDQMLQLNQEDCPITPSPTDSVDLTSTEDDTDTQSSPSESDNTEEDGPSVSQK